MGPYGQLNLSAGKELVQGSATQKEHGLQGQGFLKTEKFQEKFEICEILVIYGPYMVRFERIGCRKPN